MRCRSMHAHGQDQVLLSETAGLTIPIQSVVEFYFVIAPRPGVQYFQRILLRFLVVVSSKTGVGSSHMDSFGLHQRTMT